MGAKEDGAKFLADNARQPGVQVTPSGLQYLVVREADGPRPGPNATVEVHYHGTFINNKAFDSSYQRGEPISFPLQGVIRGWTEGVQLMSVGSVFKFFIPPHLAYGERGAGGVIPPHSTLVFEVELLGIQPE